jgi:hypothetical protein
VPSAAHLLAQASGLATGGRTGDQHQPRTALRPRVLVVRGRSGSDDVAISTSRRLTGRHDHGRDGQPDERDKDQEHVPDLPVAVHSEAGLTGGHSDPRLSARPCVTASLCTHRHIKQIFLVYRWYNGYRSQENSAIPDVERWMSVRADSRSPAPPRKPHHYKSKLSFGSYAPTCGWADRAYRPLCACRARGSCSAGAGTPPTPGVRCLSCASCATS